MNFNATDFTASYLKQKDSAILLDVRRIEEVASGALPNSVHLPFQELETRYTELNPSKSIFIYCAVGGRAERAQTFLRGHGFKNVFTASQCGYAELKDLIKS